MNKPKISGLILAGGRGTRMGDADKGLQLFNGEPLIAQVLHRFAPQVDEVIISANRNLHAYQQLGYAVYADADNNFDGPLAGMLAGLTHAMHPMLAVVPCDSPLLPPDLVERLYETMQAEHADAAIAMTGGKAQPTFCLMRTQQLASRLRAYLFSGERKALNWFEAVHAVKVNFDDQPAAFANINSLDELHEFETNFSQEPAKV